MAPLRRPGRFRFAPGVVGVVASSGALTHAGFAAGEHFRRCLPCRVVAKLGSYAYVPSIRPTCGLVVSLFLILTITFRIFVVETILEILDSLQKQTESRWTVDRGAVF